MKKLLFLLICTLTLSGRALAQNWFQPDHHWVFHISGGFAGFNFLLEMKYEKDTVIHNLPCRKWVFEKNNAPGFVYPPEYTYTDNQKAYKYHAYQQDTFILYYDFSLSPGAGVIIPGEVGGAFSYQIDFVDTVQAGSFTLKRQRVHFTNGNGGPNNTSFDILENIGMVGLPFDSPDPQCSYVFPNPSQDICGSVLDGIDIRFTCFRTNDGVFSPYGGACTVLAAPSPSTPDFSILPNPAGDFFTLQIPEGVTLLRVGLQDVAGRTLREWKAEEKYELGDFPAGVYWVKAGFEGGGEVVRKLVKE